jgi:hypothetical protein
MGSRTLRKTSEFLAQAQQASQNVPRLLEAIGGAEFVLVRTPELGMAVRDSNLHSWPLHPAPDLTYKVLYSFNDREVVFRALYLAVSPAG